MRALVLGGTGTVGSQVVSGLLARNVEVSVLTRDPDKVGNLPKDVRGIIGDLLNPETIRTAFRDVDTVFMANAVSPTETHEGLMALNGATMAAVEHFTYLSIHDVQRAMHLPHFGSKLPIEMGLHASGMGITILRANNFFQNDYWFKDAMMEYGVYPQPLGAVGLSRVDVRDIGEAAAVAMADRKLGTFNLVGPDAVTGVSTAETWSQALGRSVAYGGDDLDAWEEQQLQYLPPWMVFDFRLMYEYFQKHGLKATDEDLEKLQALLGREPIAFEQFAQETAAMWG